MISCLGVLGNLIFLSIVTVDLPYKNKIQKKIHHSIIITAKKFTVKVVISDEEYEWFKDYHKNKPGWANTNIN